MNLTFEFIVSCVIETFDSIGLLSFHDYVRVNQFVSHEKGGSSCVREKVRAHLLGGWLCVWRLTKGGLRANHKTKEHPIQPHPPSFSPPPPCAPAQSNPQAGPQTDLSASAQIYTSGYRNLVPAALDTKSLVSNNAAPYTNTAPPSTAAELRRKRVSCIRPFLPGMKMAPPLRTVARLAVKTPPPTKPPPCNSSAPPPCAWFSGQ